MSIHINYHGITDQGRKRSTNQDHFLIARLHKTLVVDHSNLTEDDRSRFSSRSDGRILLVADGMGGHAGGEVASKLAIDSAAAYVLNTIPWFYRLNENCDEDFEEELKRALEFCQRQLEHEASAHPSYNEMGTTLTMAYLVGLRLYVVHVGDSRCYVFRDGNLYQLTRDHTIAQSLVDEGQLPADLAETSPLSHVLWNAIGGSDHSSLKPDVYRSVLCIGDQILLCTDGLTRHLSDDTLRTVLSRNESIETTCTELVEAANQDGGSDNITVVLARIEQVSSSEESEITETQESRSPSLDDTKPYIPSVSS